MKNLGLLVLASFFAIRAVAAQEVTASLNFSPAQEAKIRDIVAGEHRTSTAVPASFNLLVGVEVPPSVMLFELGADLGLGQYRYNVISGKMVIIDPKSRKVVRVLD